MDDDNELPVVTLGSPLPPDSLASDFLAYDSLASNSLAPASPLQLPPVVAPKLKLKGLGTSPLPYGKHYNPSLKGVPKLPATSNRCTATTSGGSRCKKRVTDEYLVPGKPHLCYFHSKLVEAGLSGELVRGPSNEKIVEALMKAGGVKSKAAKLLKMSYRTLINRWYHPSCKDIFDAAVVRARDVVIDEAESTLRALVRDGDFKAVKFTLSSAAGRDRGWGQSTQVQVTGPGGGAVQVEHIVPLERLSLETKMKIVEELETWEERKRMSDGGGGVESGESDIVDVEFVEVGNEWDDDDEDGNDEG